MAMSTSFFVLSIASTTFFYTLSLHDALPISRRARRPLGGAAAEPLDGRDHGLAAGHGDRAGDRSEEHTSELQSRGHLVCRLLLEKKKDLWKNHCLQYIRARRETITPTRHLSI